MREFLFTLALVLSTLAAPAMAQAPMDDPLVSGLYAKTQWWVWVSTPSYLLIGNTLTKNGSFGDTDIQVAHADQDTDSNALIYNASTVTADGEHTEELTLLEAEIDEEVFLQCGSPYPATIGFGTESWNTTAGAEVTSTAVFADVGKDQFVHSRLTIKAGAVNTVLESKRTVAWIVAKGGDHTYTAIWDDYSDTWTLYHNSSTVSGYVGVASINFEATHFQEMESNEEDFEATAAAKEYYGGTISTGTTVEEWTHRARVELVESDSEDDPWE